MRLLEASVFLTGDADAEGGQVVNLPHCSEILTVRTEDGYSKRVHVLVAAYDEADGLDPGRPTRPYVLWRRTLGQTLPRTPAPEWQGVVTIGREAALLVLRRWYA